MYVAVSGAKQLHKTRDTCRVTKKLCGKGGREHQNEAGVLCFFSSFVRTS